MLLRTSSDSAGFLGVELLRDLQAVRRGRRESNAFQDHRDRAQEDVISPPSFLFMNHPPAVVNSGVAQPAGKRDKNQDQRKRVEKKGLVSVLGSGGYTEGNVDSSSFSAAAEGQTLPSVPTS